MEPHRQEDISKKIIRNTAYNIIGRFWGFLVTLFLTPYIIHHIGIERFGILALIGIITGYFGMLDFGLGTSFVKYIAEYYTKKEYGKINQIVNTGLVFYCAFTVIIIVATFFSMDLVIRLLHIPPDLRNEAVFVFFVGVALFGGASMMGVFAAVQIGLQRMDVSNKVSVVTSLVSIIGTIFFLEKGYGLCGLMVNNVIVFIVSSLICVIVALKLLPGLRFDLSFVNKGMFRNLFNFGYKMQTAKIADIVLFQSDRLLIAAFLNISLVGIYQLGATIMQQARQIPLLLVSALLPAASELEAKADSGKMQELYIRGSKYLIFGSFPLMFFVAATAQIIMTIWMGPGYEKAAIIIQILTVGYLANLIAGVGVTVAMAMERLEYQMKAAIITMVLNIILCVALVLIMGFYGIALATAIALIAGPVYFFIKLHERLGVSQKVFIKEMILTPLIGSVVPAVLFCALNLILSRTTPVNWINWGILILEVIAFTGIYMTIILKNRYFDEYDMRLLRKHFGFGNIIK